MSIEQMKRKVRIDSLVKTPRGWRYVCKIKGNGVHATETVYDMSPFPPFYSWEEISDVRN